ncbi:MAG: hypothetical protein A2504_15410 [Bdellovibrionales bacterium RIFOXYD12_FULL_39_22]|nr:MAG: hypothetical protein A2385_02840 [Bdellovibrionales bacterium RIFOXYB1_FULL_39_21]OFZ43183.1 MAG: hypothetical protein A2485_11985 [Bdellovibrionales bacterium RIFOXYC12_FULL_39_17]OFZ47921.1 MAG: hypothetical protein A2404_16625 [Bdellovibrionales bacterium RIFOXYC1_FULL_39_130]OFZ75701.1 MAG: hypothetical protein A2560_13125 [Bdellovibrionales bacterium RIFOXYD1_FULL_39_84]OFZ77263.1 MAG: hypothetical protein A2451_06745 [Bdellovibrionales bacterium RIFOXYC2_FULL_39_8]OFZ94191.1 MAG:
MLEKKSALKTVKNSRRITSSRQLATVAILLLLTSWPALAIEQLMGSDITDSSISTRCQNLLKVRELKIEHKQKIWALINRNKSIEKTISPNRKSLKNRTALSHDSLQREYSYTTNRIELLTKTILKSGCPGLKL